MSWNRAEEGRPDGAGRGRTAGRGVRAAFAVGAAVCAISGGIWLFSRNGGEEEAKPEGEKAGLLREAKPAERRAETPRTEGERPSARRKIPDGVKPDAEGVLRWPGGARYVEDYYFHTNAINPYAGQKRLFRCPTDIHISTVVNLKPGRMIVGGYAYDSRFDERFRKSLEEPVEFADDDTAEERGQKEAVIEARQILREAMERGESPAKVLQEARDELVKLFQYRQNLREMLTALEKEGDAKATHDAYRAANEMLREKGLSEFSTRMVGRKIERMKREEEKSK